MHIYIGCSGYHYKEWKDSFYPADLKKKDWLSYYAKQFNTVEINNSFYNLPDRDKIKHWLDQTPETFRFSFKANRYLTHMKKLKADNKFRQRMDDFFRALKPAEKRIGNILWQLPGNLHKNPERLESFANLLDNPYNNVIEFRHASWFDDEIYDMLRSHSIGICMLSSPADLPEKVIATGKSAYLRFHGKEEWYNHKYSKQELGNWKMRLNKLKEVRNLFIYFNNDQHAYAPKNAIEMTEMFNR
ncbi:MAG: DUF72 domain-containing protein [Bacteroidales bacterium]